MGFYFSFALFLDVRIGSDYRFTLDVVNTEVNHSSTEEKCAYLRHQSRCVLGPVLLVEGFKHLYDPCGTISDPGFPLLLR